MKNILSKTVLALGITAMVMAGCTENGTSEKQYVYLSDAACTFQSAGNEPFTITVETSPAEWTVTPGASWVTAEKSGNDLVLTVADNADGMERTTTISVTAGQAEQTITVIQLSDDDLPMRFRKLADLHSSVISPNGKWVGGYYSVGDESAGALFYIVFINLETDERIELGPYPESLVFLTSVVCMTDTGILYGIEANGGIKVFDVNEKDYYVLEVPGMNTAAIGISNISADGSFWVGWAPGGRLLQAVRCRKWNGDHAAPAGGEFQGAVRRRGNQPHGPRASPKTTPSFTVPRGITKISV